MPKIVRGRLRMLHGTNQTGTQFIRASVRGLWGLPVVRSYARLQQLIQEKERHTIPYWIKLIDSVVLELR
jgi:hypothetical protein